MQKESHRLDRIAALIQREIAKLLQQEMEDPRFALVSVTAVKLSRDLAHAKIYITKITDEDTTAETVKALNHAASRIRYLLAHSLSLRITPQLRFVYDASLDEALHLSELIDQAVREDEKKK